MELLKYVKENLPKRIVEGGYNSYEIFGKEAENPISDIVEEYLQSLGVPYKVKRAKTKNDFPDLEIEINDIKYALEYKTGACDIKGVVSNRAANDMGTINTYPDKIDKYDDNIYCIFIKYVVLNDDIINIKNIYFDKIYTFIGRGTGFSTQLQYREKDGNLRPKNWSDMDNNIIYFANLEEFKISLMLEFR